MLLFLLLFLLCFAEYCFTPQGQSRFCPSPEVILNLILKRSDDVPVMIIVRVPLCQFCPPLVFVLPHSFRAFRPSIVLILRPQFYPIFPLPPRQNFNILLRIFCSLPVSMKQPPLCRFYPSTFVHFVPLILLILPSPCGFLCLSLCRFSPLLLILFGSSHYVEFPALPLLILPLSLCYFDPLLTLLKILFIFIISLGRARLRLPVYLVCSPAWYGYLLLSIMSVQTTSVKKSLYFFGLLCYFF